MNRYRLLAAFALVLTISGFANAQFPPPRPAPVPPRPVPVFPPQQPFPGFPGMKQVQFPGAQNGHIPIPTEGGGNVRTWLEGRRGAAAGGPAKGMIPPEGISPEMLAKVAEMMKGQNPEDLRKLAGKFVDPQDLDDPEKLARMKQLIEQNPDLKDPEKVGNLLREMQQKGGNPDLDPKKLADMVKNLEKLQGRLPKIDAPPVENPQPVDPANLRPQGQGQGQLPPQPNLPNEQAIEVARDLRNALGDSDAIADIVKQIEAAAANGQNDKSLSFMPDLTDEMGQFTKWTTRQFKDPNLDLNLPKFNGPKVNLPNGPNIKAPRWDFLPSFSIGSINISGIYSLFVILVLLAMVLLLGWIAWRKGWFPGQATLFGSDGHAGSGMLDPNAINTRDDLVQAFEAIGVNQCGEEATTWNHRIIAGELGAESPVRQEAAGSLAGLYEHARYAPADDDLTRDELAKARRDISTLCGEVSR